jgi:TonB family protein
MFLEKIVKGSAVSLALLATAQGWAPGLAEDNEDQTAKTDSWQSSAGPKQDPAYAPYRADLQRRIKRAWFPPRGFESKRVRVVFKVHKDGKMTNLRILISSGLQIADAAALKAVENAAPFRPLPDGIPNDVDIEFTFDYNQFNGGGRAILRQF